jgi:hypothetical protein
VTHENGVIGNTTISNVEVLYTFTDFIDNSDDLMSWDKLKRILSGLLVDERDNSQGISR